MAAQARNFVFRYESAEHWIEIFRNYYGPVVKAFEALDATAPAEVINRLKRDQFTELNSTLLHELYFASLGGDGRTLPESIGGAIARNFGSVDRWRQEFMALASGLDQVLEVVQHEQRGPGAKVPRAGS